MRILGNFKQESGQNKVKRLTGDWLNAFLELLRRHESIQQLNLKQKIARAYDQPKKQPFLISS